MNKKLLLTTFAVFIAFIFVMAPVGAASHSISPAVSSTNYQPDPTLNTNVSWSTFYNGWNATEYNNGTANLTLNTGLSTFYSNPISVNPVDIESYGFLQNENVSGAGYWNTTSSAVWNPSSSNTSYPVSITTGTLGKSQTVIFNVEANGLGNSGNGKFVVPVAEWPSQNTEDNYITVAYSLSGPSYTGVYANIEAYNGTGSSEMVLGGNIAPGQSAYASIHLPGTGYNTTGTGTTTAMHINPEINTASGEPAGSEYHLTISALALTDYAIPLGTNATGAPVVQAINPTMKNFGSSDLKYTAVLNNGYSVAISAAPNNLSQVQTPITSGNYIEQVQYSGTFQLPLSPDLSFGTANITFPLTVPASQIQVLTLAGTSYINSLGNKTNGTVAILPSVNPTTPTSYYAIVDYTASQWQSISHPAGFFTYDGIAYYYWLAIGAIASLLGLGVGVRHAKTKREQTEKVDRITRRGR